MLNNKFENVKFELVDLSVNAAPEMYISTANVLFTRRVLEDLGNPQYVQFCVDPANRIFAVRPCKQKDSKAVDFLKGRTLKPSEGLKFGSKNLHDTLVQLIENYEAGKRYKFIGEYDSESRIMYYDMTCGTISLYRKPTGNTDENGEFDDITE